MTEESLRFSSIIRFYLLLTWFASVTLEIMAPEYKRRVEVTDQNTFVWTIPPSSLHFFPPSYRNYRENRPILLMICWGHLLCQIICADIFKEIIKHHKNHPWDKNAVKISKSMRYLSKPKKNCNIPTSALNCHNIPQFL